MAQPPGAQGVLRGPHVLEYPYRRSLGPVLGRFFNDLRERKLTGIRTRGEALHVLGFPPTTRPDMETIQARYRALAAIHHPDNEFGNHQRMSQLNTARDILSRPYI